MERPAVSLVASPGKRAAVLELAGELDQRGYAGIACPSLGGAMSLCVSLAHTTKTIPFFTSIQPIYLAHANEAAASAAHVHELSGGRFSFGIGVSHVPFLGSMGIAPGKPLGDIATFTQRVRKVAPGVPVILATLRDKMLTLATEVADGAVWANTSLSATAAQLARVPAATREGFFLGNMIPTVIDADKKAARAVHRKTLTMYVGLPNYRNNWKQAGYVEEMEAIEAALAAGQRERVPELMSDRWLDDCTLSGSAAEVREGFERWRAAGITTPIAAMSSTTGGQAKAIRELLDAYD